jgi:hypothetical protein
VPNVPYAQKSCRTHPMLLLGDEALVDAHFGPFGYSADLDAIYVHGLSRMYHRI